MRFGHSLIDGRFNFIKDNGFMDFANLTEEFFNSDVIYDDGMKYSGREYAVHTEKTRRQQINTLFERWIAPGIAQTALAPLVVPFAPKFIDCNYGRGRSKRNTFENAIHNIGKCMIILAQTTPGLR